MSAPPLRSVAAVSSASLTRYEHLCTYIAFRIDTALNLEQRGAYFEYATHYARPRWFIDVFRDAASWNVHVGRFQLTVDRPYKDKRV